jgi:hypothetical protein
MQAAPGGKFDEINVLIWLILLQPEARIRQLKIIFTQGSIQQVRQEFISEDFMVSINLTVRRDQGNLIAGTI